MDMEMDQKQELNREEDSRLESDFITSLRDFMDEQEVDQLNIEPSNEQFRITTKEQANFYLRKLQEIREQNAQINTFADNEIARLTKNIQDWRERELAKTAGVELYFVSMLENFAEMNIDKTAKTKSMKLPFGSIGFKKQQDKYEYNEEVLLKFLQDNNLKDLIKIKEEPKKADLKKVAAVQDGKLFLNGIEVTGVTVTPQPEKFDIKLD